MSMYAFPKPVRRKLRKGKTREVRRQHARHSNVLNCMASALCLDVVAFISLSLLIRVHAQRELRFSKGKELCLSRCLRGLLNRAFRG